MFQFNHCISQHFWFIFFYHRETQVWYTPNLRKGKWYFGSSAPPTMSTHPSAQGVFWSASVSNRSESTLARGQESLESWSTSEVGSLFRNLWVQVALSASHSPPATHDDTLPRAACTSCPTMYTSRHFLISFPSSSFSTLKVADLYPPPKFRNPSSFWLKTTCLCSFIPLG